MSATTNATNATEIPGYSDLIKRIADKLNIADKQQFTTEMKKYDKSNQYSILNNKQLQDAMLSADEAFSNLIKVNGALYPYESNIRTNWDNLSNSLGQLQALSILSKISPSDCGPVIDALVKAFDTKIKSVNSILAERNAAPISGANAIKKGGYSDLIYKNKYLKYKQKYLQLKNNL